MFISSTSELTLSKSRRKAPQMVSDDARLAESIIEKTVWWTRSKKDRIQSLLLISLP